MSGVENELPSQQSAIVAVSRIPGRNLAVSHAAPLPALEPDQVLVKTAAVALNPCDWKMPDNFPSVGAVDGSDFAGTVVALGSAVDRPDLSVGDRVCGAVHGSNPADHRSGSFAEYVAATADILMRIPDGVPWEEGAAIGGTGIATLGLVFYEHMKIEFSPKKPAPAEKSFPVLIYGGGTATGTMATQLIRQSGLRPIVVCSNKSASLAMSYGAEKVFDYNDPNCAAQIKDYVGGRLSCVLDIITDPQSIKLCYEAIGRLGGTYVGLELLPEERPTRRVVRASWVLGQTIFGKELQLSRGYERPAMPEHRQLGKKWFLEVQELWHARRIRPHPVKARTGGLDAVLEGIDQMRRRTVAREKLVYFFY